MIQEHIYLVRMIKDWKGNPVLDAKYELAEFHSEHNQAEFYFFGSDETGRVDDYEVIREIEVPEILGQLVRHD